MEYWTIDRIDSKPDGFEAHYGMAVMPKERAFDKLSQWEHDNAELGMQPFYRVRNLGTDDLDTAWQRAKNPDETAGEQ